MDGGLETEGRCDNGLTEGCISCPLGKKDSQHIARSLASGTAGTSSWRSLGHAGLMALQSALARRLRLLLAPQSTNDVETGHTREDAIAVEGGCARGQTPVWTVAFP